MTKKLKLVEKNKTGNSVPSDEGNTLFCVKIYHRSGEVLVAVADRELIGMKFRGNGISIEVAASFYNGDLLDGDAMIASLGFATIANLVGKRCISLAIRHGFIKENNVIYIGDVPHAQMLLIMQ